ncbi:hypothetical protein RDMS_00220 [Deinococcus sp. RL]|nr:hypothetical protein RDMS_00220 [Deinococcus sp. RL]
MTAEDERLELASRPQLLTSGEVARVIRLSERRVRYWLDRDLIPWQRIGGQRYVRDVDLIQWANVRGLSLDWPAVI